MTKHKKEEDEDKLGCPLATVESVVQFINSVIAKGGFSKPMPRKNFGILFGKHPNQFTPILSSGKLYDLLSNEYGVGYFPTERFNKIVNPVFESDKIVAYHEAMQSPILYKTIIERYNGRSLPEPTGFINLLKSDEFKITANTAEKGVKVFFDNANDLNILGENRKLKFLMPDSHISPEVKKEEKKDSVVKSAQEDLIDKADEAEKKSFQVLIPLSGGKVASIKYPKGELTKSDIKSLDMFIKLIEESEGLNEKNQNGEKNKEPQL